MKHDREEYLYSGIPTFMRAPYVDLGEAGNYDVGIVGLPVDYGVSYRDGARHAPRAIREYSHWDRVEGREYVDLDTGQATTTNNLSLADVGDVLVHPGDAERTNGEIERIAKALRSVAFPLFLGGDHSVTYASFKGCAAAAPLQPVGLLHLDAHLDVEQGYLTLPRVWHGNPFRMLIEEGQLSGDRMVTIGPRGSVPREWWRFIQDQGVALYTTQRVRAMGTDALLDEVVARLTRSCASVYVSVDIDCLDPSQAPGTGTPSPGGLMLDEVCRIMRGLHRLPIAGFDLTEVSPRLDPSGRTLVAACDILWNFLAFGLRRQGIEASP